MLQACSPLYSTQDLYSTEMKTQEVLLRPSRSTYHTEHTFQGEKWQMHVIIVAETQSHVGLTWNKVYSVANQ